jgi:16S rRNA (cytosine1402-N4)-methyltransferase
MTLPSTHQQENDTVEEKRVYHIPVLVEPVIEYLDPKPGGVYVDVTFGGGGHTRAILEKEPSCSVIAIDWDTVALERNGYPMQEEFGDRLTLLWGNFSHLVRILKRADCGPIDGILADFGTSQFQLSDRAGFSFNHDTILDMRMSPAHQKITAAEIVNQSSAQALETIFFTYGEERNARKIAAAIVKERAKNGIGTTGQLARLVEQVCPRVRGIKIHPATRVFQALRIAVNHELENIHSFLAGALHVLKPGGRLVCISFHSLEDRLVKQFMRDKTYLGALEVLTRKAVIATEEESSRNASSRSAKLRAALKCS